MGRINSKTGNAYCRNRVDHPSSRPSGLPVTRAAVKAMATRRTLAQMCA
ncbi:Uncharacterised protein [Mycobacterium tuberculosis]|nr:Uncharacterised protein [Mycobacterium tuberculosis]